MSDSSSEFESSDEETVDNIGAFNLLHLTRQERADVERFCNDHFGNNEDIIVDFDFEGFDAEETYRARVFENWVKTENPKQIHEFTEFVGPTRVYDGSTRAIDYFQVFYSDELFDKVVELTNLNAETRRRQHPDSYGKGQWSELTRDELKTFYGLQFLMDIMKYDREELYWSNNTNHWLVGSKFGEVMSRNRYLQIKRYLHFCDDSQPHDGNKLYKVCFMLEYMRDKFMSEYKPHREVTVDESMIPFKGRLGMKQYMKDKPVKWGVKLWVAADAVSAYCYNFEVYVGKKDTIVSKTFGLSSKVVIELCKSLEQKGHVIYTDNFYTSLPLADYLYQQKTYLCGTIRPSRKCFPKDLVVPAKDAKKIPRGSLDWRMCDFAVASYWMDNRLVYYLSTYHAPEDARLVTERRKKDGTVEHLSATPAQVEYARFMGGVDRLDQMTRMCKEKKSLRWYRKIETKLRLLALYNAYIIEGTIVNQNPASGRKRDLMSFKLDVAHSLIGNVRTKRPFKRPRSAGAGDAATECRLDNISHLPTASGSNDKLCVVCLKKHNYYKTGHPGVQDNPFKRTKTSMACGKCNIALCCKAGTDCYRDYHEKVYYWQ